LWAGEKIKKQNSSSLGTVVVGGSEINKQNSSSLGTVVVFGSENKDAKFQLSGNSGCRWE
jgi:hypothetical protein